MDTATCLCIYIYIQAARMPRLIQQDSAAPCRVLLRSAVVLLPPAMVLLPPAVVRLPPRVVLRPTAVVLLLNMCAYPCLATNPTQTNHPTPLVAQPSRQEPARNTHGIKNMSSSPLEGKYDNIYLYIYRKRNM